MPIRCFLLPVLLLGLFGCTKNEEAARPVPPPIPATEPARPADTRPVVVAFGDSLTAGYGVDSGQGWPEILQGMLDQKGLAYRVVNQGISGDTTSGGLARVSAAVSLNPKAVILELGANDGLRGLPVASTEENLSRMIAEFQKSRAKVLLAGITLPRNYGPDYIRDFDRLYPALAKKYKTAYLPFLMEGVALDPKLMQQDALHPNAEGHRKMAALVWKYLEPLLE
jgi:acyl-CoA thioesterase-1